MKVGLEAGDSVFTHSNIGFFGKLEGAENPQDYYRIFKEAIFEVIGEKGAWILPAFSYSFCRKEIFDVKKTPGVGGILSEMMRNDPQSLRSIDANFSVVAIGDKAKYFTEDAPDHSFGDGCFWEKFLKEEGKFCNFNFDAGSTFIHHVEKVLKVPYRYDKAFPGQTLVDNKLVERVFCHFVYDLDKPETGPVFTKFNKRAKELGLVRTSKLGKGEIVLITARDVLNLIKTEIKKDPGFLIRGE